MSKQKLAKHNKNSKCRLCDEIDEMFHHRISKFNKLAQKEYKTWLKLLYNGRQISFYAFGFS